MMSAPVYRIHNLWKTYRERSRRRRPPSAGDDFALAIPELEISGGITQAILGHSGSGKSTLLNTLALMDRPDSCSGSLELMVQQIDGSSETFVRSGEDRHLVSKENNKRVSPNFLRREYFGFVFQAGHLHSNLSARQNVMLPLALEGSPISAAGRRSVDLLRRVSVQEKRFRGLPRHLSGGEYHRVAVARALAHEPQIVFADEPTGNLDPRSGRQVMELLHEWREASAARTLFLVTHNVQQAIHYSDRVMLLINGRVVLNKDCSETSAEELFALLEEGRQETAPAEVAALTE